MATYYAEGIYYATLTDLLSYGWDETQSVEVYADPATRSVSTVAALRSQYQQVSFTKKPRTVAVANEGFAERTPTGGYQYAMALILEDSPGWVPGHWWPTLEEARLRAREYNRRTGISPEEALDVQVSSMRASRVR